MYHLGRLIDLIKKRLCFFALKVTKGGGGNQLLKRFKIFFLEKLADKGGADWLVHGLFSGDNNTINACQRQLDMISL